MRAVALVLTVDLGRRSLPDAGCALGSRGPSASGAARTLEAGDPEIEPAVADLGSELRDGIAGSGARSAYVLSRRVMLKQNDREKANNQDGENDARPNLTCHGSWCDWGLSLDARLSVVIVDIGSIAGRLETFAPCRARFGSHATEPKRRAGVIIKENCAGLASFVHEISDGEDWSNRTEESEDYEGFRHLFAPWLPRDLCDVASPNSCGRRHRRPCPAA